MRRKHRVAILFGGKSAEHEVSLQSAKSIIEVIDQNKYEMVLIRIDKKGRWFLEESSLPCDPKKFIRKDRAGTRLALAPGQDQNQLVSLSTSPPSKLLIDVVFPVLHGPFGEDGTVQGLLKLAEVPFVGSSVLGSAVSMDKEVSKRLLRDAGISTAKFLTYDRSSSGKLEFSRLKEYLGLPLFVKPANLGSSVGINKANDKKSFHQAIDCAFQYDDKILVEECIWGREFECSVLGNQAPIASTVGEVIPQCEFYSYRAKYLDENSTVLKIPARIPQRIRAEIRALAIKTFRVLCCEGMARVDFFLAKNDQPIVNELNTIPGFTKISMYPKLWEVSGIYLTELIDRLIQLAMERFDREQKLRSSFDA